MPPKPASVDTSPGFSKPSAAIKKPTAKTKSQKEAVADSWEDEDISSGSDAEKESDWPAQKGSKGTEAPPPTPITPNVFDKASIGNTAPEFYRSTSDASGSSAARPEKTDAVARRMIAGALGMRAPKLTDEQRAYQNAIKENERKKREEQKAAEKRKEEEAAKAKAAMWDD